MRLGVSRFVSEYKTELVSVDDYFTFKQLQNFPGYSIKGASLLNTVATVTYQGKPWEILEENGLVLDLTTGQLIPIASQVSTVRFQKSSRYYLANGLVNPGSLLEDGSRVHSYRCQIMSNPRGFLYSEVRYV